MPGMFFRKKQPAPELTNDAYHRWLRAHRPPFTFFLGLSQVEQEALACIGDDHAQEMIEAHALAVANPRALEAGLAVRDAEAGDVDAEESLARTLASAFVAKIKRKAAEPAAPPQQAAPTSAPRESLAGFGTRRKVTHQDNRKRPALFGREPDEVTT